MELYYYTSTDTMRYILEKGDIFATNIRYMNDSEEYLNGLEELKKLANDEQKVKKWLREKGRKDLSHDNVKQAFTDENLKKNMQDREYYSISFCEKNDLLSQWAIYAKEAGVSIKMEFGKESYLFETNSTEKGRARWNLLPKQVYYFTSKAMKKKQKEYDERAFSILDELFVTDIRDYAEEINEKWKYVSTFVKRYDFYQEAESRIVFQPKKSIYPPKIKYRNDKNVLKPYLDIECVGGWPIWEIMIGPGNNQQIVNNSVVHFLDHAQIKNGIESIGEYGYRVLRYFQPYTDELEKFELYADIVKCFSDSKMAQEMRLEDAQRVIGQKVKELCNTICASNDVSKELRDYVENNCFTCCGIVVSRSSIPYIF